MELLLHILLAGSDERHPGLLLATVARSLVRHTSAEAHLCSHPEF